MRSPRTKDKREVSESDESQPYLNIAFSCLPKERACLLLEHFQDEFKLREKLCQFLENSNLTLIRPRLAPRLTILLDNDTEQSDINKKAIQNSDSQDRNYLNPDSNDLIGPLNPESNLWDAALLDYLMECIFWAGSDWYKEISKRNSTDLHSTDSTISIFNTPTKLLISHHSTENVMAISFVMTTVYALIRHLQIWQLAKQGCTPNTNCPMHDLINEATGLVAEIRFLKLLFQNPPKLIDSNLLTKCCLDHHKLGEFQNQFAGFLSVLNQTAATILIEFLNENFFHMFRLMESVFGPTTAHAQNVIEIPCPLRFDTILLTFENQNASWPPPLSEAVPLKFVGKYKDLFDNKVTRWLNLVKDEEPIHTAEEPVENVQDQTDEKPISEPEIQIPEPSIDWSDKYLAMLDSMTQTELEAIAKLSSSEIDQIVKKLINQILISNNQLSDVKAVQIKMEQTNLANKLIEKSKSNLARFAQTDLINEIS